jgi:predicted acyltransferase
MATGHASGRIISMDQFRGIVVLSMFTVHYSSQFPLPFDRSAVWGHNNTFLSFADAVLPSFLFAAGFSLRLSMLHRTAARGAGAAYRHAVRRCLLLVLLLQALMFDRWGPRFRDVLGERGLPAALDVLVKGRLWESLSIIGLASLWTLPVIAGSVRTRVAFLLTGLVVHAVLCQLFYFDYLYGRPNWLDAWAGATGETGYEGGPLGVLTWAIPVIAGSLAYDLVVTNTAKRAAFVLLTWSAILLAGGYLLSCLSTLYPLAEPATTQEYELIRNGQVAASPVLPTFGADSTGGAAGLVPPPFVRPGANEQRQLNYWTMGKRVVTPSFAITATGYAVGLYALCVLLCDAGGMSLGLLRTFGQNPLAAYILHLFFLGGLVRAMFGILDKRYPGCLRPEETWLGGLAYCLAWFGLTYGCVRILEKRGIYLRL